MYKSPRGIVYMPLFNDNLRQITQESAENLEYSNELTSELAHLSEENTDAELLEHALQYLREQGIVMAIPQTPSCYVLRCTHNPLEIRITVTKAGDIIAEDIGQRQVYLKLPQAK